MTAESKIQWTNYTWNPFHGCKKVSEGCKFCYMYRDKERYGQEPTRVIRASKNTFEKPLHIKEKAFVFTCSWSDFFIEEADEWRDEAWDIIRRTPHLTYQILTKRPENILARLPKYFDKFTNVWLGVSVENQDAYDYRTVFLKAIKAQTGWTTFISAEPLLERINLWNFNAYDWVIIGGESGNENGKYKYRPCGLVWIESIVSQCDVRDIPVFVKQLGTYLAKELKLKDRHGGDINEFPSNLQIRQYPN